MRHYVADGSSAGDLCSDLARRSGLSKTRIKLAMARGAGEVAPLMLVGAVKLAPDLPLDGTWPFLHLERSFMHLGFHIYDLGFQSQNSEAAKPMVFTTTMLLMAIVLFLNAAAIWFRSRLTRKYTGSKF